jgi:hypothetical protein
MLGALLAREGAILRHGLVALGTRATFLSSVYSRTRSLVMPERIARGARRATRDLALAIPWVPVLAIVPGSVALVAAASFLAPFTLPSTFAAARASHLSPPPNAGRPEIEMRAAISISLKSRRLAVDATGDASIASLCDADLYKIADLIPDGHRDSLRASAARYNDIIALDDEVLRVDEQLSEGPFSPADDSASIAASACAARGLSSYMSRGSSAPDTLRAWLVLRREFAPVPLLAILRIKCGGKL